MKKEICLLLVFILMVTLCACSSAEAETAEIRAVTYREGSSYGISYVLEGPAPVNNRKGNKFHPADTPIILIEDDNLEARLIGTFEQKYGAKDDRKLGRGAAIEFTNLSQDNLLIGVTDAYIADQSIHMSNLGCPDRCSPGQTIQINFILYTKSGSKEIPIEDTADIYQLEGTINTKRFIDEDNVTDSKDYSFSISGN